MRNPLRALDGRYRTGVSSGDRPTVDAPSAPTSATLFAWARTDGAPSVERYVEALRSAARVEAARRLARPLPTDSDVDALLAWVGDALVACDVASTLGRRVKAPAAALRAEAEAVVAVPAGTPERAVDVAVGRASAIDAAVRALRGALDDDARERIDRWVLEVEDRRSPLGRVRHALVGPSRLRSLADSARSLARRRARR